MPSTSLRASLTASWAELSLTPKNGNTYQAKVTSGRAQLSSRQHYHRGNFDQEVTNSPICDMGLLVRNCLIRRQRVFRHSRPHHWHHFIISRLTWPKLGSSNLLIIASTTNTASATHRINISQSKWRLNSVKYVSNVNPSLSNVNIRSRSHTLYSLSNNSTRLNKENEPFSNANPPTPPITCDGAIFSWDLDSPFETYPFITHKSTSRAKPGYSLLSVNPQQSTIHVRSLSCSGISKTKASPCFSCQKAGDQVAVIRDRALQDIRHGGPAPERKHRHFLMLFKLRMKKKKNLGFQKKNEDAMSRCERTLLTHDIWVIYPLSTTVMVNLLDETANLHVIPQFQHHPNFHCGVNTQYSWSIKSTTSTMYITILTLHFSTYSEWAELPTPAVYWSIFLKLTCRWRAAVWKSPMLLSLNYPHVWDPANCHLFSLPLIVLILPFR